MYVYILELSIVSELLWFERERERERDIGPTTSTRYVFEFFLFPKIGLAYFEIPVDTQKLHHRVAMPYDELEIRALY